MKRLLSLILATLVGANYSSAGIRITVPQKWKGKTLYIWQTDINQAMKRNADEPVHQVRDTVEIKELTFDIPLKLDVATKVNVMTPKRNESDFDHTIGEACILPGEDVHMILDENIVKNEGSLLNKQMAEIYTYYIICGQWPAIMQPVNVGTTKKSHGWPTSISNGIVIG